MYLPIYYLDLKGSVHCAQESFTHLTLKALRMVNRASGPDCLAVYVFSTFTTLVHVSLLKKVKQYKLEQEQDQGQEQKQ